MIDQPSRQWSRTCPSRIDIHAFMAALSKSKLSSASQAVFKQMASLRPDRRLAVNLKVVLGLAAVREINNVLLDGLTDKERNALIELDLTDIPIRLKEVAHGLLDIHNRWTLVKRMDKAFRQARAARTSFMDPHILNNILGET